ncbi:hypothetical protein [Alterisphingorhabdus coralli]|uniref:Uncharacterized protein n=1 Tax=Alterisphingorhabdus coralli TaxID=3071408 RepID=A0AA97F8V9_9SPHN|nr:hypothetical protein [Parasphingorhabdus sp. SCSIO 66989]WOE75666.1 hypothetical protein RB602_02825 [Parasphingorhabdus sp. SCSIO 66989]
MSLSALSSIILPITMLVQPAAASEEPSATTEIAPLTLEQKTDVRCAAAFATIAVQQQRGVPSSASYPSMEPRGREFFVDVGARLIEETGRSREQVQALFTAEAEVFQKAARDKDDPNSAVDAIMTPCLFRLDAEVPRPPPPSLPQCAAIMALAYEEVFAEEGLSPRARDLKTLATVLDNRARTKLRAEGNSGTEADVILGTLKAKLAEEASALEAQGKSPNYDYEACYELAEP